jgi:hypothetical protein
VTEGLHRICHRHIHANFTEAELADQYSTIEALLATQEIQRFVAWGKDKAPRILRPLAHDPTHSIGCARSHSPLLPDLYIL